MTNTELLGPYYVYVPYEEDSEEHKEKLKLYMFEEVISSRA